LAALGRSADSPGRAGRRHDLAAVTLVAETRIDRYAHGIAAMKGVAARYLDLTIRLKAAATTTGG